jgi:hypothetical protein
VKGERRRSPPRDTTRKEKPMAEETTKKKIDGSPDELVNTSKEGQGSIELTEGELGSISGGAFDAFLKID